MDLTAANPPGRRVQLGEAGASGFTAGIRVHRWI
jgi:hypothetical protein